MYSPVKGLPIADAIMLRPRLSLLDMDCHGDGRPEDAAPMSEAAGFGAFRAGRFLLEQRITAEEMRQTVNTDTAAAFRELLDEITSGELATSDVIDSFAEMEALLDAAAGLTDEA